MVHLGKVVGAVAAAFMFAPAVYAQPKVTHQVSDLRFDLGPMTLL